MRFWGESKTPFGTPGAEAAGDYSPGPLLDAFENFHGDYFDLEQNRRTSAGEIKRGRDSLREKLERAGVRAGDRIVMAVCNGPLFASAWAACLACGASPVLAHGGTPEYELREMVKRSGARFVAAEGKRPGVSGEGLEAEGLGNLHCQRTEVKEEAAGKWSGTAPLHPTSGTAGEAKLAVRPGKCAVAEPRHYIETLGIEKKDVILCAIPMSHAYGYGICFLATLLTSSELVFARRFQPELVLRGMDERGVTILPAVPAMLDFLAADSRGKPRVVLSAGAPLGRATFEAYAQKHGRAPRPLYGTTETGGISIGKEGDGFEAGVGPAMNGVEVEVKGGGGREVGVLRVRSSSMMAGYWENGGISNAVVEDGWFETGDVARIDRQGRICLLGRQSEVINVLGYKVLPKEVEEVIAMLPGVLEVKVYAGRHWEGFEIVKAVIACRGEMEEDEVLRHCEKHLVSFKCPSEIRFVTELPRTATGKIAITQLP